MKARWVPRSPPSVRRGLGVGVFQKQRRTLATARTERPSGGANTRKERAKRASAVVRETLERAQEARRALGDAGQRDEAVRGRRAALAALELIGGDGPPVLVDDRGRVGVGDRLGLELEVLGPQP